MADTDADTDTDADAVADTDADVDTTMSHIIQIKKGTYVLGLFLSSEEKMNVAKKLFQKNFFGGGGIKNLLTGE